MKERARGRMSNPLVLMCCLVYFSSYLTRVNYAASILAIVDDLRITKTAAGMAMTGAAITYGLGQFFSGVLGDKMRPDRLIFMGLLITVGCNLAVSALSSPAVMTAVWCVNGLAQAMMWPPMTRILASNLDTAAYKHACVLVSAAASVATIALYLLVPVVLSVAGWRVVFRLSALAALVVALAWRGSYARIAPAAVEHAQAREKTNFRAAVRCMLGMGALPVVLIIILQGVMRDGVTTWMPVYIDDVYHLGASISILSTAVLPVISILSLSAASWIHTKAGDELRGSAVIWAIAGACVVPLILLYASQAALSVVLMSVLTGCMHGVNLMLICVYPSRFVDTPYMSTISGVLNAFTYVGASISNYGFAALSERFGWGVTIIFWGGVVLCGLLLSLYCVRKNAARAK